MIEKFGMLKNLDSVEIETVTTLEGDKVSYCLEKGGIITSLIIGRKMGPRLSGSKEILYFDEESLIDPIANTEGGIQVLFPNAGPIPPELKTLELSDLEPDGFARKQKWEMGSSTEGEMNIGLRSNPETEKVFPYQFKFMLSGNSEPDGSFTFTARPENFGMSKDMPVSFGMQVYLKTPGGIKNKIEFDFPGGEFLKQNTEEWINGNAVSIDNPNTPLRMVIPYLGTLFVYASPEYKKIRFWGVPGKDFIRMDVVMDEPGGIVSNPKMVDPSGDFRPTLNLRLESPSL